MNYNVSDEIRKTLMESAAWDRMGLEPTFLNEDDDGEEAPAEEATAEEAPAEEVEESEEEVSDEEISEALATLLSVMSDDQLLEHIESVLAVVDKAAEVLEEEEESEDTADS